MGLAAAGGRRQEEVARGALEALADVLQGLDGRQGDTPAEIAEAAGAALAAVRGFLLGQVLLQAEATQVPGEVAAKAVWMGGLY